MPHNTIPVGTVQVVILEFLSASAYALSTGLLLPLCLTVVGRDAALISFRLCFQWSGDILSLLVS